MRKSAKNKSGKPRTRAAARDAEIIRLHVKGVVHPRIAEQFGITRERVRQIVALYDQQPRRIFQRKRRAETEAREAIEAKQRKIKREARLQALSAAWKRGDSISVIAEAFGIATPNAANALISYRRKRHPLLFPLRKPWIHANSAARLKNKPKA